jgi:hypothetical protein
MALIPCAPLCADPAYFQHCTALIELGSPSDGDLAGLLRLRPLAYHPRRDNADAEAILFDYRVLGNDLWGRFNGGADGTRWYYGALDRVFSSVMPGRLSDRLSRAVAAFAPETCQRFRASDFKGR